jgi:hypothetical protein
MSRSLYNVAATHQHDSQSAYDSQEFDLLANLILWLLLVLATLAFGGLVALFAEWREELIFWQNQGGYPVWLRYFVWVTCYPLLAIFTGVLSLEFLLLLKEKQAMTIFLKGLLWLPLPVLWVSTVLTTLG